MDPRSIQSTRGRSLILWRGRQWSVTNNGVETTDPGIPHIIVPLEHLDRVDQIIDGCYSPLLSRGTTWFDIEEFIVMVDRARTIHYRGSFTHGVLSQGQTELTENSRNAAFSSGTAPRKEATW